MTPRSKNRSQSRKTIRPPMNAIAISVKRFNANAWNTSTRNTTGVPRYKDQEKTKDQRPNTKDQIMQAAALPPQFNKFAAQSAASTFGL
jgi:hypothetical protein